MLVVRGYPPRLADVDERAGCVADEPVTAGRPADGQVSGVVADVADLSEHESQERRVRQLESRVVHGQQDREAQGQHGVRRRHL